MVCYGCYGTAALFITLKEREFHRSSTALETVPLTPPQSKIPEGDDGEISATNRDIEILRVFRARRWNVASLDLLETGQCHALETPEKAGSDAVNPTRSSLKLGTERCRVNKTIAVLGRRKLQIKT
jgi:hypothetical protein